jgi:hypothetical protein
VIGENHTVVSETIEELRQAFADEAGQAIADKIDRRILGEFIPELWSADIIAAYKDNLILANFPKMQVHDDHVDALQFDYDTLVENIADCPRRDHATQSTT